MKMTAKLLVVTVISFGSCLASSAGTVTAWGRNNYAQTNVPASVTNVTAIAAGAYHNLALQPDGTVRAWGANYAGQINVPAGLSNVVAVAAGAAHSLALKSDGTVVAWGSDGYNQIDVPAGLSNVVAIAGGVQHSLVLKQDGTVVAWGNPSGGGPGSVVPANLNNVVAIAASYHQNLALKSDGTVTAWGSDSGLTNSPADLTNAVAIAAAMDANLALKSDGSVKAWGYGNATTNVPMGLTNVVAISGAFSNFIVLKADGTLVVWGNNTYGQFNIPSGLSGLGAIAAGYGDCLTLAGNGAPQAVQPPFSATVLAPNTVLLVANFFGPAPLTYQWKFNGTNLAGAAGPSLLLTNLQMWQAGSYSLSASNAAGLVDGPVATLTVVPLILTMQPTNQLLYFGDSLNVSVQGSGSWTYQWQLNGSDLTNETNSTLLLSQSITNQPDAYSVIVSNLYGSATNFAFVSSVFDSIPFIVSQPASIIAWPGENAIFQVSANGSKPLSYQWRFKGTNIVGATNATFSLAGVTANQAGNYSVTVSNAVGSTPGSSATLTLVPVVAWGDTNYNLSELPTSLTNAIAIAAGYSYSVALKPNGTVVSWGNGPQPFGLTNVAAIVAGYYQSLALESNGTVVAWDYLFPSVPAGLSNVVALAMGYSQYSPLQNDLALKSDGTVVGWGNLSSAINNVPAELNGVTAIAVGTYHALALKPDGTVTAWLDYSDYNANRVPTNLNGVVAIAAGYRHSVALKSDGTVRAWGQSSYTQTNVPAGLSNVVAIAAGGNHSLALKSDGTIVAWGANDYGQTAVPAGLSNVVAVSAGGNHSLALVGPASPVFVRQPCSATGLPRQPIFLSAGVVSGSPVSYQWQFNGQNITSATNAFLKIPSLGRTDQGNYRLLVSGSLGVVTSVVAQVTMSGNAVIAWGLNDSQQTNVPAGLNALAVAGGGEQSLALRPDGTVAAWGGNDYSLTNVPLSASNVIAIAASMYHNLALRSNGTVVAWGNNSCNKTIVPATNAIAIAASPVSSVTLRADGKVSERGCETFLPATLSNVVAVAAGNYYTLALKSDGSILAAGSIDSPPADLSNVVAIASGNWFIQYALALKSDGTLVAWGVNAYGVTDVPVGLSNVVAIAAGGMHVLVLKSDGTLVAWGNNDYGQMNVPVGLSNVVGIAAGFAHNLVIVGSADPAIVRQPAPAYASVFGRVLLSIGAVSSQPVSYQWLNNGLPIPGATNSSLDLPTALPSDSGIYSVVVSNALGVAVSSNANVTVIGQPPFILIQPVGQTNLGGTSATFQTAAAGSLPFNYLWQKDGTGLLNATNTMLTLNNLTRSNSGTYSLVVSNTFGSLTSSDAVLHVMVPQQLQSPIINPDGSVTFKFGDGDSGLLSSNDIAHFTIGVSTNLVDWDVLTNPLFLTNGLVWLQDFDATNFPQRYYRVIENP
jgi:alpha-tubulin suppressor-like RCC1 family protein